MIKKVKIFGAGSIGNHLSNASRLLGWSVDLCDIDAAALDRTKLSIYPQRYGIWDSAINLYENRFAPKGEYDLICIGTPPDSHLSLAIEAINELPKAILIEKPLCSPDLNNLQLLFDLANEKDVRLFVGYDHIVGEATRFLQSLKTSMDLGSVCSIDVEFREHWGGIFAAHPWLNGPEDSYLGYTNRGGGASGEHSHAINLWQHLSNEFGCGRVTEVQASLDYINHSKGIYDQICLMHFKTENGLIGRCVQDVITKPSKKNAHIQFANSSVDWICNAKPGLDLVNIKTNGEIESKQFQKTRPDDFVLELKHINTAIKDKTLSSPISIERGLDTMLVIAAAHLSDKIKRTINIDYSKGYNLTALSPA
jgi:predicted dehydrogenase